MKLIAKIFQHATIPSHHRLGPSHLIRSFSLFSDPFPGADNRQRSGSFESADDFEHRIFSDSGGGNGENRSSFWKKLDKIQKAHDRSGMDFNFESGSRSEAFDGQDGFFNTLSDGMDEELKKAAFFEIDYDEVNEEDYSFRPDLNAQDGMVLDTKVLDLTKPAAAPPVPREEFETTTEEVLKKADFRNVRFLANFITEAGIIIKRKKTGISAKAQRRIAREIKTARAFGLMPFTCMGTKEFVFGKTMENLDKDFEFTRYGSHSFVVDDDESLGA